MQAQTLQSTHVFISLYLLSIMAASCVFSYFVKRLSLSLAVVTLSLLIKPVVTVSKINKYKQIRDRSSSMGRATKWENRGSKTCCVPPPPPQNRVKLFLAPPFKGWKLSAPPPPPSVGLKLRALMLKLPQNLLCSPPPSAWPKVCEIKKTKKQKNLFCTHLLL